VKQANRSPVDLIQSRKPILRSVNYCFISYGLMDALVRTERVPPFSRVAEVLKLAGAWSGLSNQIPQLKADNALPDTPFYQFG